MYCFIHYVLFVVFGGCGLDMLSGTIFKAFKSQILSSLRSKASESLNNSTYYFLSFTLCMHAMFNMNPSMFILLSHFLVALIVGLHFG
jgi:hypothetical protein